MNIVDVAEAIFPQGVELRAPLAWDKVTGYAPERPVKCKFCPKLMPESNLWGHGLSAHAGRFKGFKRWLYAVDAKAESWKKTCEEANLA